MSKSTLWDRTSSSPGDKITGANDYIIEDADMYDGSFTPLAEASTTSRRQLTPAPFLGCEAQINLDISIA
jgi:hypothetical protein